ncbi:sec-independent protein translocase protein TATA, chloroplastic-like [Nymphaea colorata]|nr:sec-independent protein translocase protein TATA, chloroplastic-like [Nymphaea colorata]
MKISSSLLLPSASLSRIPPPTSLSSNNSLFFSNGSKAFRKKGATLALRRRNGRNGLDCRCLFGLGVPELAVIVGVAALVFGPKKLPEIGRSIGKTVKSFQQAAKEFETELKKDTDDTNESSTSNSTMVGEEKQDVKM